METKRAKVIMLPTKDFSHIVYVPETRSIEYLTGKEDSTNMIYNLGLPQHLYFTTDEEIKEGDWFYNTRLNKIFKAIRKTGSEYLKEDRKIIATTDKSLILKVVDYNARKQPKYNPISETFSGKTKYKHINLPQPSQAFIEKYCKLGRIDEVLVEYESEDWYDNQGVVWNTTLNIKVDSHNTITISPIKNSYNREEMEEVLSLQEAIHHEDFHVMTKGDMLKRIEEILG